MRLDVRTAKGATVITVSGTITMLDPAGQLKQAVSTVVATGDRNIVLSLHDLTMVDSSFIGELVSCSLPVARAGGTLKLSNPARRVRELLLVTRLSEIFECYETDAAAIASFTAPPAPHAR